MNLILVCLTLLLQGGVIKEDFIIHPDPTAKCGKGGSSVASLPDGWVVVWSDQRNGPSDIFGQIIAKDGTPIDANFRVNTAVGSIGEANGSVLADSSGNFMVTWATSHMLWSGRRFSATGEPLGDEKPLVDTAWSTTVAMNARGEYVVAWLDPSRRPPWPIVLQAFNPDDTPKGAKHAIDSNGYVPHAAIAPNGSSVVVWKGMVDDLWQVFGRRCDSLGFPAGETFQVSVSGEIYPFTQPDVGMDKAGNFVVAWIKQDTTGDAIYFRSYYSSGTPKAAPQLLKEFPAEINPRDLKIGVADDGSFAIIWSDNHTGKYQVYLQCYSESGSKTGEEIRVSADTQADYLGTALAVHGDDWFAGYTKAGSEIVGRRGTLSGLLSGDEVLISDDEASAHESGGQVMMDDAGNFIVIWTDEAIYGQRFTKDGESLADPFQMGHYGYASMNRATGEFAVVWRDEDSLVVYVQRYSMDGQAQASPIRVNPRDEEVRYIPWWDLDISLCRSGSFTVVWLQEIEGMEDKLIAARRFDAEDNPLDVDAIVVSDSAIGPGFPDIAMRDDKSFIVTWNDYRIGYGGDVFARRFGASGKPLGGDFEVNEDTMPGVFNSSQGWFLCITINDQGNFCIAWSYDDRNVPFGGIYAYAQFFDAEGNKLGNNVNTGLLNPGIRDVGVAASTHGFAIFGTDWSNPDGDPEVRASYYDPQGRFIGRQQINQPDFFPYNHQLTDRNCVACINDRIVYAWQDNRRHKGWDIFAKITDWDVPGIEEQPIVEKPPNWEVITSIGSQIVLRYQDSPDGFRASIFDATGRKVAEIHATEASGMITWGRCYGPGVYFIVLKSAEATRAQKVVLIK